MRVCVIGGGVAGLAAAHRLGELARGEGAALEVDVLEAGERLGGSVWSESIEGYPVVDGGADMFITDKPWALGLCRRIGLEEELVGTDARYRRSLVWRGGRALEVPEGFMLMAPSLLWPMVKTPLLSWRGKARAAADLVLPRGPGGDESIASFVRRRFGSEMLDRLVQPLVGGIYTGDPEELSLRATLPRFLDMERDHRSVTLATLARKRAAPEAPKGTSGARYGLFLGLQHGMRRLVERLAERTAARVRRSTRATAIVPAERGYRIETAAESIACDAVVLAVPAFSAAALCRPFAAELAAELDGIPYASTAVVVSGHALRDVAHPLDAFGLVIPHAEGRRVLAVSFASRKLPHRAPKGGVQLRTFVGGALQPELFDASDSRIEGIVEGELRELLGVEGTPDFLRVVRHPRSMPQYRVGHLDRVEAIERAARRLPGFALAGNAYRGVGIPDCVHSGENAAEAVFSHISQARRGHAILEG